MSLQLSHLLQKQFEIVLMRKTRKGEVGDIGPTNKETLERTSTRAEEQTLLEEQKRRLPTLIQDS